MDPNRTTGTIYISGPMTGLPEFNIPLFNRVARTLRAQGYKVINPAEAFCGRTDLPWEVYIEHDLELMNRANTILTLPGWENSRGAWLEMDKACCRDMNIIHTENE